VVDQTVNGDVQQGIDATARVLMVNDQGTPPAWPTPEEPLPAGTGSIQVAVGDIPREPPGFLPRPDLLAKLDRAGTRVAVIHAVTGLRGLGATQLAAAYARAKLAADWRLVAWVNAADSGSLQAGLAAVADAMALTDSDSGRHIADPAVTVRRQLETDGDRCLLVFDDAADPEALRSVLPAHGTARVLIVSTRPSATNTAIDVPVDVFSADEALWFLTRRTGLDDAAGAAEVAGVLGHLPLALALAVPVIEPRQHGYARYLDRLQTIPIEVFLTAEDGQSYPHGVARAVLLSLAMIRAADQTGVSTRVLEIMAVLSSAGVRRELLHAVGQAGVLATGGRRVEAALIDRVLEWLSERSLLTVSLDGQTVIMHGQVARVVRDRLARRHRLGAVCWAAASALEAHATAVTSARDRLAARSIPLHVTALLGHTPRLEGKADEELAIILLRLRFIAFYQLIELGDSALSAIAVGEPLTEDLEWLLGPDDPDTLNSRNSLAAAYLAAGHAAEAIPLFEQTLTLRQRLLGPHDPETLNSRNNLAAAYQDAGRAKEAIQLFEQTLLIREQLLGADDPSTLNSRGNLAAAYRDGGQVAEAIRLFEQTLADRERVLGPDHPDTQTSRKNLAYAYRGAGRAAEAIPLFERISADRERDRRRAAEAMILARRTLARRQPLADVAGHVLHLGFRRPSSDPAKRVLPSGIRRPPTGPARRLLADRAAGKPAKLSGHPSAHRAFGPLPKDAQYDRRAVAAIAAGHPAGIAAVYDRYAAGLYGYCHWVLRDAADAADALLDTFVIAVAKLRTLREPSKLRPLLYAVARSECRRRLRIGAVPGDEEVGAAGQQADVGQPSEEADRLISATTPIYMVSQPTYEPIDATMPIRVVSQSADATMPIHVISPPAHEPIDATMPIRMVSPSADAAGGSARVNGDWGQAELRALIRSLLVDLKPREREVIELSFRHDLFDNDLAIALGVSWSRTQALASYARGRLEKSFGAVHATLTGRQACPVLGELLVDWDGQLTEQTRDLAGWHAEQCPTCANNSSGALWPAAIPGLLPLAPLRPELRERVLSRCSSTADDAVAYRRRTVRRAESRWFAIFAGVSHAVRRVSWHSIRANPGVAVAATATTVWVIAAVGVTLLTFAGSHIARAQTRPSTRTSASSPAAPAVTATVPVTARASVSPSLVPTLRPNPTPAYSQPAYVPPASPAVSASPSATPSKSPEPSKSPSPSPSPSLTPSPSSSASPSLSPSASASPSPST
jgi:RNA polymerase sigma factor (sigma-70 family)